jgi:hypothetical protein
VQIILVSRHLKAARTITIMPRHLVAALFVFLALVFSTSALFSWLSVHLRLPLIEELLVSLQLQETRKTRDYLDNNLQLMATRLGELQARVLQLDAMGDRVSGLAGIKREAEAIAVPGKPGQGVHRGADAGRVAGRNRPAGQRGRAANRRFRLS